MQIAAIFASLAVFSSFAAAAITSRMSPKMCSNKLGGVIYQPETYDSKCLKRVSGQLLVEQPLLFTEQQASVALNFAKKWNLNVLIYDAFGTETKYASDGTVTVWTPSTPGFENHAPKYSDTAKTYLNMDGYDRGEGVSFYSFHVFDKTGHYLLVTLEYYNPQNFVF